MNKKSGPVFQQPNFEAKQTLTSSEGSRSSNSADDSAERDLDRTASLGLARGRAKQEKFRNESNVDFNFKPYL